MGTRADFYVGRGETAEWLGSIAWDGYPCGIDAPVLAAKSEQEYRAEAARFFATREDVTLPGRGWPWPWDDSRTTDYAYAYEDGMVWAACFGYEWFIAAGPEPGCGDIPTKTCVFPNMAARKNVALGERSGLMMVKPSEWGRKNEERI